MENRQNQYRASGKYYGEKLMLEGCRGGPRGPGGGEGCGGLLDSCGRLMRGYHEARNFPLNMLCSGANLQGPNSLLFLL